MLKKLGYSKAEASQVTSLSKRTLDYLIQRGKLRATRIGRRVVIPVRELERLVGERKHPAGTGNLDSSESSGQAKAL